MRAAAAAPVRTTLCTSNFGKGGRISLSLSFSPPPPAPAFLRAYVRECRRRVSDADKYYGWPNAYTIIYFYVEPMRVLSVYGAGLGVIWLLRNFFLLKFDENNNRPSSNP
jgi:hypothetical protein